MQASSLKRAPSRGPLQTGETRFRTRHQTDGRLCSLNRGMGPPSVDVKNQNETLRARGRGLTACALSTFGYNKVDYIALKASRDTSCTNPLCICRCLPERML